MRTDNAMKTSILIALTCMLVACAVPARAADNVTTSYFAGAVTVLATATNMGDTGLGLGTNYVAFPLTSLSGVTTGNTADVRAVLYGIAQAYYVAWNASTNQSNTSVSRSARYAAGSSNVTETVTHALRTERIATTFELE